MKSVTLIEALDYLGFQALGREVREMHGDMNVSFREMSEKYDVISQNLGWSVNLF